MTEREQVDLARDQSVDERVAGNHVVDRDVIEGITPAFQVRIDMRELPRDLAQRCFDRSEIEQHTLAR